MAAGLFDVFQRRWIIANQVRRAVQAEPAATKFQKISAYYERLAPIMLQTRHSARFSTQYPLKKLAFESAK
jgi:hypothetical protein